MNTVNSYLMFASENLRCKQVNRIQNINAPSDSIVDATILHPRVATSGTMMHLQIVNVSAALFFLKLALGPA